MNPRSSKLAPLTWVFVAGAAIVLGTAMAVLFSIATGRMELPGGLFYVVLIPMGLAAAGFLFGAMRSQAKYSGQSSYGNLELSGPAVMFALVVVGGLLANRSTTFSLTVRVHGPGGPSEIIREGKLTVDLGDVRRDADINSRGEVTFPGVSSELDGTPVTLIPDVPGYELRPAAPIVIPASHVIDLGLVRREYATAMRGSVRDASGQPVRNATVNFNHGMQTVTSDQDGNFSVVMPLAPGTVVDLVVTVAGRIVYDEKATVAEQPPLRIVIGGAGQ